MIHQLGCISPDTSKFLLQKGAAIDRYAHKLNSDSFWGEEFVNFLNSIIQLFNFQILMNTYVCSVIRTKLGFGVISYFFAQNESDHTDDGTIKIEKGTVLDIPSEYGSFDLILCKAILHEVWELWAALAEINRVCKPDSKLSITKYWVKPGGWDLLKWTQICKC